MMRYHSLYDRKVLDVEVEPYHLMYNHRAWYLLAYSHMHHSVRTFKLNRIQEITPLQKCIREAAQNMQKLNNEQ